jgi:hypothetical protein
MTSVASPARRMNLLARWTVGKDRPVISIRRAFDGRQLRPVP